MKLLFKNPLFLTGFLIKFIFLPFFASSYLTDLFIPFIDSAIQNPFVNPWNLNPPHFFPYGSFLFFILYLPKLITYYVFGNFALGTSALSIFIMKLPLLLADIFILNIFLKLLPYRKDSLLKIYWLNPIIFYVCYYYGQLDIIAMSLCIGSLYWIVREKDLKSALAMSAAVLSKFHIVSIIPFIIAYLWQSSFLPYSLKRILKWTSITFLISIVGFTPLFLSSKFFYASTTSPEALRVFSIYFKMTESQVFYLGIFVFTMILGRLCISTKITRFGLIYGASLIFGTLILITAPLPAWYIWVLPFLCLFFSHHPNTPKSILMVLNLFYLIYFIFIFPEVSSLENTILNGFIFTILQCVLAGCLIIVWILSISKECPLNRRLKPILIGISGDSGSGKNYLSLLISSIFNYKNTQILDGDHYHNWERNDERWNHTTHLNPNANQLYSMSNDTKSLQNGIPIIKELYDHETGEFTAPLEIRPARTLIIQGLHTLYHLNMRNQFDLKIFINTDKSLQRAWKIIRDTKERGHSIANINQSIVARMNDSEKHIQPQISHSDLSIEYIPINAISDDEILAGIQPKYKCKYLLPNYSTFTKLISLLQNIKTISIHSNIRLENMDNLEIEVNGTIKSSEVQNIANQLIPDMRYVTRSHIQPKWHDNIDGISQIIIISLLRDNQ